MAATRTITKRKFARMQPVYARIGGHLAAAYPWYISQARHRAWNANAEKYLAARVGWQLETGNAVLFRSDSGRYAVSPMFRSVPAPDGDARPYMFALPFRLSPFLVLFVASHECDQAFTSEIDPDTPPLVDYPDHPGECQFHYCRWCTTIPGSPQNSCDPWASPNSSGICDCIGCVGYIGETEMVDGEEAVIMFPPDSDNQHFQNWDIRGDANTFAVSGRNVAKQYLGVAKVSIVPKVINARPGCYDWYCHSCIEREGGGNWRIQCHDIDLPNQGIDSYPELQLAPSMERKSAVVHMRFAIGERTPTPPGGPCWATQNPNVLTGEDYQQGGYGPYYHSFPLDDYIQVDADMRYNAGAYLFNPLFDKPRAWRVLCDDVLKKCNTLWAGVGSLTHANLHGVDKYPSSRLGRWEYHQYYDCNQAPVVPTDIQLRGRLRSTGFVYGVEYVIREMIASVTLAFLPWVDTTLTHYHVLAEVNFTALLGVRRTGINDPRTWYPSYLDASNPDSEASVVFDTADKCHELATATLPGGREVDEQFILQAYDSTSGKWGAAPRRVDWRGLSGPSPFAYPAWQAREVEFYGNQNEKLGCAAIEAINGLVIPAEPTNPDIYIDPVPPPEWEGGTAAEWAKQYQEHHGDVVLVIDPSHFPTTCVPAT